MRKKLEVNLKKIICYSCYESSKAGKCHTFIVSFCNYLAKPVQLNIFEEQILLYWLKIPGTKYYYNKIYATLNTRKYLKTIFTGLMP